MSELDGDNREGQRGSLDASYARPGGGDSSAQPDRPYASDSIRDQVSQELRGTTPGPTIDRMTGHEVGRFIADARGNVMIEPVGGSTTPYPPGNPNSPDTHTLYPNGSNYNRLNPEGHGDNKTGHAHAHAEGTGPNRAGQGDSLDVHGNRVPYNSPAAHWPIH